MKTYTHADLVQIAATWLRRKHSVVVTELAAGRETADAIGWSTSRSTLVEVKVSRADFRADRLKPSRRTRGTMGVERYYLTPRDLLNGLDIPPEWGLLEVDTNGRVRCVRPAQEWNTSRNLVDEVCVLVSALRRVGSVCPAGVSVRAYTHQTKCTATLSVELEAEAERDVVAELLTGRAP